MALSYRSVARSMASTFGRAVRVGMVNWGILSLFVTIVVAGILGLALVAVPPGTVPYP